MSDHKTPDDTSAENTLQGNGSGNPNSDRGYLNDLPPAEDKVPSEDARAVDPEPEGGFEEE